MYLHLHLIQRETPPLPQVTRKLFNVAVGKTSGGLDDKKLIQFLLESTSTESMISSSAFD